MTSFYLDGVYIDENEFLKPKARPKKTWYVPIAINDEIIDVGITPDYIFQLRNELN